MMARTAVATPDTAELLVPASLAKILGSWTATNLEVMSDLTPLAVDA